MGRPTNSSVGAAGECEASGLARLGHSVSRSGEVLREGLASQLSKLKTYFAYDGETMRTGVDAERASLAAWCRDTVALTSY